MEILEIPVFRSYLLTASLAIQGVLDVYERQTKESAN